MQSKSLDRSVMLHLKRLYLRLLSISQPPSVDNVEYYNLGENRIDTWSKYLFIWSYIHLSCHTYIFHQLFCNGCFRPLFSFFPFLFLESISPDSDDFPLVKESGFLSPRGVAFCGSYIRLFRGFSSRGWVAAFAPYHWTHFWLLSECCYVVVLLLL